MSNKALFICVQALCMVLITGCGYQLGQGNLPPQYTTISVPYVGGDPDGSLTAAVIRQINLNTNFDYVADGGSLILKINLMEFRDDNIGFRYDRNQNGKLTKTIVPTETRTTASAEVAVIEAVSGRVVVGPVKLIASMDYDHDYYSSRNRVNVFSLGQLSDIDAAHDGVYRPLGENLAKKIVSYIYDLMTYQN